MLLHSLRVIGINMFISTIFEGYRQTCCLQKMFSRRGVPLCISDLHYTYFTFYYSNIWTEPEKMDLDCSATIFQAAYVFVQQGCCLRIHAVSALVFS